jgi:hypothetical protein
MEPPKRIEFFPVGSMEQWCVERFDLLAVEFQLSAPWPQAVTALADFASVHTQTSTWFIVRRLFGITPLIPPADASPDDLRCHTREELCASLNYSPEQLKDALEFFKTGWNDFCKQGVAAEPSPAPSLAADREKSGELGLDDGLLARYQFSERFFEISIYDPAADNGKDGDKVLPSGRDVKRSDVENRAERDWFINKLRAPEWQKMLDDTMGGSLARAALINSLYLRRLQDEMMPLSPSSAKFKQLQKTKEEIESQYSDQIDRLQSKFPELGIAGRVSFRACVSDLNLAHRSYYGRKDNRLWDKIHTSSEIIFLTRTSAQLPSPRYRLGWSVAVVEAMHSLYDPNFRTQLRRSDLKKLDLGFKRGVEEARRETGEKEPDIETGVMPGDGDDFMDFPLPEIKDAKAGVI